MACRSEGGLHNQPSAGCPPLRPVSVLDAFWTPFASAGSASLQQAAPPCQISLPATSASAKPVHLASPAAEMGPGPHGLPTSPGHTLRPCWQLHVDPLPTCPAFGSPWHCCALLVLPPAPAGWWQPQGQPPLRLSAGYCHSPTPDPAPPWQPPPQPAAHTVSWHRAMKSSWGLGASRTSSPSTLLQ